jgi:hypothetical protein
MLDEIIAKYLQKLVATKHQLEKLKNEPASKLKILNGMESLPELKERVLLTVEFLEDLKKLKENAKEDNIKS